MYSLSKKVHYLVFVAESGIRLSQNLRYYSLDRTRIYNESIIGMASNILKFTIPKENDD